MKTKYFKRYLMILTAIMALLLPASCEAAVGEQTPVGTPAPDSVSAEIEVDEFATGLNIPWEMAFSPDGRIFITERPGSVRVILDDELQQEPWIELEVADVGEGGLLGLALDPDFADNHFVYVAYTYRDSTGILKNRLERLIDDPDSNSGSSDRIILDDVPGGNIHDGGRVKFGPDGKIYWTTGDVGNANLAQDTSSLAGKILRINPDGSIPDDNPFPDSPVYSYGHRNPQGLAWQPDTGRLYATEHGASALDEVNYIEPGNNYGWPVIQGDQTREGMESPVIHSGTDTWAPAGAAFVTGGPWDGSLLFTGLRGRSLYRVTLDPSDPGNVLDFDSYLDNQYGRLRNVVQGPDGAIYLLTNNRDGRGSPMPGDDKILRLTVD